jgi:hypothetical protein
MNLFLVWLISFYQLDIFPLFKIYISLLEVLCKIVYFGHNGCSFSNVLKLKPKIGLNGFKNLKNTTCHNYHGFKWKNIINV